MAFIENRVGDCVFMTSSLLSSRHMFTTRLGGVSEGVYESWNLGENRGDDLACVRENFRRAGALMGTDADGFVITKHEFLSLVSTWQDIFNEIRHRWDAAMNEMHNISWCNSIKNAE